jgi:hypothetical protein
LDQQLYGTILEELKSLLREGAEHLAKRFELVDFDPEETKSTFQIINRWNDAWKFYFRTALPYLQAAFLPLQMQIKGSRLVNSVQTLVLLAFRDFVVLPGLSSLESAYCMLKIKFST